MANPQSHKPISPFLDLVVLKIIYPSYLVTLRDDNYAYGIIIEKVCSKSGIRRGMFGA